jgi:hypothetical protein
MTNHRRGAAVHHDPVDMLTWPLLGVSIGSWPFLGWLWEHWPTPTGFYMLVSAGFMLFQIADKMGWLDRFRTPTRKDGPP